MTVPASRPRLAPRRPKQEPRPRRRAVAQQQPQGNTRWTFLSNHVYVLACLARDSRVRLRDVALSVGITERAVQKIVADLEVGGIVKRTRNGRRNHYQLFRERPLRHSLGSHPTVGALLDLVLGPGNGTMSRAPGGLP